jgi:hypothetical protein
MPFGNNYINGYLGGGAFWITIFGYGFLFVDTAINQLSFKEYEGGMFIGRFFFREITPENR